MVLMFFMLFNCEFTLLDWRVNLREAVKVANFRLSHNLTSQTHPSKSPLKIDQQQKMWKKRIAFLSKDIFAETNGGHADCWWCRVPSILISDKLPHNYHLHFFATRHLFFLSFLLLLLYIFGMWTLTLFYIPFLICWFQAIQPSYHITITSF